MFKSVLFLVINIFFLTQSFAQKDTSLHIKSPLVKILIFKDTTSKNVEDIYHKCQKWKLSVEDAYKIFSISNQISSEEKAGLYNWLPCYFKSKILYRGCTYTMEINAASFIVLYNKKSTLYFGCSSSNCENYFVLSGGNASSV